MDKNNNNQNTDNRSIEELINSIEQNFNMNQQNNNLSTQENLTQNQQTQGNQDIRKQQVNNEYISSINETQSKTSQTFQPDQNSIPNTQLPEMPSNSFQSSDEAKQFQNTQWQEFNSIQMSKPEVQINQPENPQPSHQDVSNETQNKTSQIFQPDQSSILNTQLPEMSSNSFQSNNEAKQFQNTQQQEFNPIQTSKPEVQINQPENPKSSYQGFSINQQQFSQTLPAQPVNSIPIQKPTKKNNSFFSSCFVIFLMIVLILTGIAAGIVLTLNSEQIGLNDFFSKECNYEGTRIKHGQTFESKDGCNSCICDNGKVTCTKTICNQDVFERKGKSTIEIFSEAQKKIGNQIYYIDSEEFKVKDEKYTLRYANPEKKTGAILLITLENKKNQTIYIESGNWLYGDTCESQWDINTSVGTFSVCEDVIGTFSARLKNTKEYHFVATFDKSFTSDEVGILLKKFKKVE